MKSVLNVTMSRRITLLNLLFTMVHRIDLEILAKQLNTSKKTILSDIEYFQENWPEIIRIDNNTKTGIQLFENKNQTVQTIYNDILGNSVEFQLLQGIFFEPGQNSKYWEDKLFISNSSLYRMGLRLEKKLREFGIILEKNPFSLSAINENQLRIFFKSYFFEVYGMREWPFEFEKERLLELLKNLCYDFQLDVNEAQLHEQVFTVAVMLVRSSQGHLTAPKYSLNEIGLSINPSLFEEYLQLLPIDTVNCSQQEQWQFQKDFLQTLLWWKFAWDNQGEAQRIRRAANDFIDQIAEAAHLTIDDFSRKRIKELFIGTYLNHKTYPYSRYIFYNRNNFSKKTVEMNFAEFSVIVKNKLQDVQKKYRIPWIINYYDDLLCKILIMWENLSQMLERNRKRVKIGICSDLGPVHAKAVAHLLARTFTYKVDILLMNSDYFSAEACDVPKCQIYVANYLMQNVPQENLIVIRDIPTAQNMATLRLEVEDQRAGNSKELIQELVKPTA